MSGNEHVMAIREALKEAHALTFEGDTIGIRRVLSGPQNVYLDALAAELAEANARAAHLAAARNYWKAIADLRGDMGGEPELARLYALLTDDGIPDAVKALVRSNLAITASQLEAWT